MALIASGLCARGPLLAGADLDEEELDAAMVVGRHDLQLQSRWIIPESRLTAAIPMDNPYCGLP